MLSGGVEPPTLTDAPGVRVSIPADPSREGRGELNSPAGAVQTLNDEASGLVPEVLHSLYLLSRQTTTPLQAMYLMNFASRTTSRQKASEALS